MSLSILWDREIVSRRRVLSKGGYCSPVKSLETQKIEVRVQPHLCRPRPRARRSRSSTTTMFTRADRARFARAFFRQTRAALVESDTRREAPPGTRELPRVVRPLLSQAPEYLALMLRHLHASGADLVRLRRWLAYDVGPRRGCFTVTSNSLSDQCSQETRSPYEPLKRDDHRRDPNSYRALVKPRELGNSETPRDAEPSKVRRSHPCAAQV